MTGVPIRTDQGTDTQREDHVKNLEKDGHLQGKERVRGCKQLS